MMHDTALMLISQCVLKNSASNIPVSGSFSHSFALSFCLTIRENSRGRAHRLWRRKLANSASWHATVEATLPFLLHHLHRLPRGYCGPQVRLPAHTSRSHTCLTANCVSAVSLSSVLPTVVSWSPIPNQTQVLSNWLV